MALLDNCLEQYAVSYDVLDEGHHRLDRQLPAVLCTPGVP